MGGLDGLGEDLVLLSVLPGTGRIGTAQRLGFGLMGSELVRLAAAGRITIAADQIVVQDPAPCGDPGLDAALASLAGARGAPRPETWVGRPRRGICDAYLARLAEAGAVRAERGTRLGMFPVTRWRIADPVRLAAARARLDAVALSDGPAGPAQAALGGLAHAVGLGGLLYPGRANRAARQRLEQVAAAAAGPGRAAVDAARQAAQEAAVRAAVDAATAAAVHASVHAAGHGGAGAHGHH